MKQPRTDRNPNGGGVHIHDDRLWLIAILRAHRAGELNAFAKRHGERVSWLEGLVCRHSLAPKKFRDRVEAQIARIEADEASRQTEPATSATPAEETRPEWSHDKRAWELKPVARCSMPDAQTEPRTA